MRLLTRDTCIHREWHFKSFKLFSHYDKILHSLILVLVCQFIKLKPKEWGEQITGRRYFLQTLTCAYAVSFFSALVFKIPKFGPC